MVMDSELKVEGERNGKRAEKFGKGGKWDLHGKGAPPPRAPHNRRLSGANRACELPLASTPGCVLSPGLKSSPTNSPCYNSLIQMSHLQLPVLHVLLTPLGTRACITICCALGRSRHTLPAFQGFGNWQKLLSLRTSLPR